MKKAWSGTKRERQARRVATRRLMDKYNTDNPHVATIKFLEDFRAAVRAKVAEIKKASQ